jgi:hypothetical protein
MHISTSVAAGLLLLLGTGLFAALSCSRALLAQIGPAPGLTCIVLAGVAAGVLALGCRLCVAEGLVSWSPYLDQWHAEISGVAVPLSHGTLGLRDLVAGNNEHRVILTRAVALCVMMLDGCWDNRVLVVVNYMLESLAVAWVCILAWGLLGWAKGSVVCVAALLPMLLVCDWETVVSSNQMQFVFMAVGSVIAFSIVHDYSLGSMRSWAALAVAVLMLGSMASGFLTALSMAATGVIVAHVERRAVGRVVGFCGVCAAVAAVGWMTRVDFTALYPIYAKSVGAWLKAFLMYASWPLPANLLGFLGLWAPWGVLVSTALWRRKLPPLATFAMGLGIWGLLQACALGWARAGFVGLVSSRYTEFLGWGFVANAASIAVLFRGVGATRMGRVVPWAVIATWMAAVGGSEIWRSQVIYDPFLVDFRSQTREHEERLGTFMRTDDARVIESVNFPRIPYVSELMIPVLRDPLVQPLLPAPLRRDLVRDRQPDFLSHVEDGPLNFVAIHMLTYGPGLVGVGLALLVGAFMLAHRPAPGWMAEKGGVPMGRVRAPVMPQRPGRLQAWAKRGPL